MKLIKSLLALTAAVAVGAGAVQAATPVTFGLTTFLQPGNIITQGTINNSVLLLRIGTAINTSMAGLKLAANTNGNLVIIDGTGAIVLDLSNGTNTGQYKISTKPGVNGSTITNYTTGFVSVADGNNFFFWDPIFSGTETPDGEGGASAFNVKANVIAGYFEIEFGASNYAWSSLTGNHFVSSWGETIEVSDGATAAVACSLAAGTYKQSFTIAAAGRFSDQQYGNGVQFGSVSLSGTQVGGSTFLDPFNGSGNYDTDFDF